MTLSQAIRLGSMIRPQSFNELIDMQGSCALGAALEAAGVINVMTIHRSILDTPKDWNLEDLTLIECPACGMAKSLVVLVTHLNDHHRWTREQIADWIEANIEAKADQPVAAEVTR